jgi:hypothetical protein
MKTFRCQSCGVYCYSAADQKTCARCQGKLKEETMSNKKASDVKDNHDAIENNQVQDSTETEKNQIPDEILRELAAMQKRFRELYSEYKLCGIGDSEGVHITSDAFIETFKDYEISDFRHSDYIEKLKTTAHGVGFFCIR